APKPPAAPPKPPAAAGTPPVPPKPPAAGGHAAPPKPKGPAPEPWSHPIVDALKEKFGGEILKAYSFIGQNQIDVKKARIGEIMLFLRDNSVTPFDYLVDETAVHWPKDEEFEIVYILYSFEKNERIRVKARVKEWEEIESVVAVWSTANWLEREVYDMFGVRYAGHPDLRRILLPEDWVGFPLRKDYNLRLQDVEWVRKHLGIDSGQKYYVGEARAEDRDYITPTD
ncbi:MAG TPA: NADH-quinone oxidoreductase subunit C, partial [Terriglobia bacterium]|nr:NADH-quinone oxidoreductase subunit C [Terriglobia bacterium]